MNDEHWDGEPCPECGAVTWVKECASCEDGFVDLYEEDPIFYSPGEIMACNTCGGTGIENWCPQCGWDAVWGAMAVDEEVENGC